MASIHTVANDNYKTLKDKLNMLQRIYKIFLCLEIFLASPSQIYGFPFYFLSLPSSFLIALSYLDIYVIYKFWMFIFNPALSPYCIYGTEVCPI